LALRKGNDRDKFWLVRLAIFDPIETFDRLLKSRSAIRGTRRMPQEQLIREWIGRQSATDRDEVETV